MKIDPFVLLKAFFNPFIIKWFLAIFIIVFLRIYLGRKIDAWLKLKSDQYKMKKFIRSRALNELGNDMCPRCGSRLILRTARRGKNAGSSFLGCSNFPKCSYTQPLKNN